jgi:hypothetical protein
MSVCACKRKNFRLLIPRPLAISINDAERIFNVAPPKTTLKDKFLCEKKINQLTTEIDLAQAFSWV